MAGAMTTATLVIGSHLLFCRGGTTIDGVAINADTAPPDLVPVDNWINVGDIADAGVNQVYNREKVFAPSPGQYKVKKRILLQKELSFQFTVQELSNLFFQLALNAAGPIGDAGTGASFIPNDSDGEMEGWWKLQMYGGDDVNILNIDMWGAATLGGGSQTLGNATNFWTLDLEVLDSPHNTAGLYTFPFTAPAV